MSQICSSLTQSDEQSVTGWFHALQAGNDVAATQLWDRCFERIVRLARGRFAAEASYDEEDLALSVFDSLVRLAGEEKYREIENRDELWALLIVIAQRKMSLRNRHHARMKRGGEQHIRDLTVDPDQLPDPKSNPQFSAEVADECRHLLQMLGDEELRTVALLKLEGRSVAEIAMQLNLTERTIKRKTAMIRKIWQIRLDADE